MVRAEWILKVVVVGLLASLGGYGCGSKGIVKQPSVSTQLYKIGFAYVEATDSSGFPPEKKDDLLPFLLNSGNKKQEDVQAIEKPVSAMDPADFFRSLGDSEEFVILWGVNYQNYRLGGDQSKSPVIAYEKYGQDGKRYVLQFRKVSLVTDEELATLPFPKGHKAP